ncbi:MAG: GLPGLI family protein [Moheibacter sp.]
MKLLKFIFLIGIIGFPTSILKSQELLNITYEVSVELDLDNMKINGISVKDTNLADAISATSDHKFYYELFLNKMESSFRPIEKINNEQPAEPGSIRIIVEPGGKNIYKDFTSHTILEEKSFLNKKFIVRDSLRDYKWNLTNETKIILDYEVRKAVSVIDSTRTIEAWYAVKIPFKDGPFKYWGLPGLILEVEITNTRANNDKSRFLAIKIEASDKIKINKPGKGEILSEKEFIKLVNDYEEKQMNVIFDGVDTSD